MPLAVNSGCSSSPCMICWLPEIPWNVPASQESRVLQVGTHGSSGSSSGGQGVNAHGLNALQRMHAPLAFIAPKLQTADRDAGGAFSGAIICMHWELCTAQFSSRGRHCALLTCQNVLPKK